MDIALNILYLILAIVVLIVIHEFGHFAAARLLGVEVEEFGIGFPPRALKLFTWRGTLFSLNWIPLGGFVRPKGENDPGIPGGLAAASPWVRIAVFFAGPLANMLTAILLYAILIGRIGAADDSISLITDIAPNSPAHHAGLLAGDQIVSVAGVDITSSDLLVETIAANAGKETVIVVLRGEATLEVSLIPRENPPPDEGRIGIAFTHPRVPIPSWQAIIYGWEEFAFHVKTLITLPAQIRSGAVAAEDARLVGYVTMGRMFNEVREREADDTLPAGTGSLNFFAYISLSLGLLNLLPIPAVDGGRILFALPEIILRRRIPPRLENAVNLVSFALLLLLLIWVNVQDIVNPVDLTP
jgi:regulator of sigma E protease